MSFFACKRPAELSITHKFLRWGVEQWLICKRLRSWIGERVRFWQQTKIEMKNDFFAQQRSMAGWLDQEALGSVFPDERLGKRFRTVLKQLANGSVQSIPFACQDWANTKAAYRFFANERVTEEDILGGHFRSTRERFSGVAGTMLVLHDTTQLSYRRENIGG